MDEIDAFDEEFVPNLTREMAKAAFPGERQLFLLCFLSEAQRPVATSEILSQLQRYHPDFVSSEDESLVGPTDPAGTLMSDITNINQGAKIIVNRAEVGQEGIYQINPEFMSEEPVRFTAAEASWLEVGLRFLEGDHTILLTKILGLSDIGKEDIIDLDTELRIPGSAQTLFKAIMQRNPVTFDYRNMKGTFTKDLVIEPWKLYFHNGYFYVQGHYPNEYSGKFRTLHLSRFESEVTINEDVSFTVPNPIPPIDLDSPLHEPLLFALAPNAAHELRHRAQPVSASEFSELSAEVTAHVPKDWELFKVENAGFYDWVALLKEFLADATVVSPAWFRDKIIAEASQLSKLQPAPAPRGKKTGGTPKERKPSKISKDNAFLMAQKMRTLAQFLVDRASDQPVEVSAVTKHFGWEEAEVRDLVTRLSLLTADEFEVEYSLQVGFVGPDHSLIYHAGETPDWIKLPAILPADAINLFLGLEALSRYVPTHREAITAVENKVATIILQSPGLTLVPLGVDTISAEDGAKLEKLWDAIESKHLIEMEYTNAADEKKLDRVAPVAILAIKDQIYLQGIKQKVRSYPWRLFRLERMNKIRLLEESIPAARPRKSAHKPTPVTVRLGSEALPQVDQIREARVLKREKNGDLTVELSAYDDKWLTRTLLSFGKDLRAFCDSKAFPEMTEKLQEIAKRALANYQV
ncbi:MAG: WYL domain-containing protein [Mobiluncus sp.]|uniref:helix-turn-helix transcriptional regulator n=1 Tax=Mobiluncus sp. TaxID=47293 RepID=UPI0025866BE5|nr:WYL domain-containing protein [Mobiluncus sp.]MCI6585369.1 WYL domain-containing protein [Mobiluncus sp.]